MDGGCGCNETAAALTPMDVPPTTGGGAGDDVYTGAAVFGRVYATIGAIIGVIIALILIIAGYSKLRDPRTSKVNGVVTKLTGCTPPSKQDSDYECVGDVSYTVAGKKYVLNGLKFSSATLPKVGGSVALQYDPKNPSNATHELPPRATGWGLIGGGVLVGALTVGIAAVTYKSKAFAAGYGAIEGVSMIGRSF
jgi:hypothetical protein